MSLVVTAAAEVVVVVPLGAGLVSTFCLSLVAATAAAFANALVTSLADLASDMVLFDDAAGGVSGLPADAVSTLTLSLISVAVVLSMSLSVLSLGFRMAEGGLWVMGAKSSCSEMTDATE